MTIKIFGNPVAQGRPRFSKIGNFVRTYDPEKSRSWKNDVRMQAILQKPILLEGALILKASFYLLRPKTLPKKILHHTKKPDLDNLIKGVKDALKGICYRDDSQVVESYISKTYSDIPGVIIEIMEKN